MIKPFVIAAIAVCSVAFSCAICTAQLQFNYNSVGNPAADTALREVTALWAAEFEDNITINLNFSFANLGAQSVATASSATQINTFAAFRSALGDDIKSVDDLTMHSGLPTGSTFSAYMNRTSEAGGVGGADPYVDDDGGANNSTVVLTTANAKAIGLRAATDGANDGAIVFNSSFAWDFDPSDGITPGTLDFVGVATHEIGHTLGFESGVDDFDAIFNTVDRIGRVVTGTGLALLDDNDLVFVTPLDFLRFSADAVTAGANIDWTADARDKYLSIDGGLTNLIGGRSHWSTGVNFGEGDQASHWKDGLGIGVMSPTTTMGMNVSISSTDVQVFDVIGYDRTINSVPEPRA